MCFQVTQLLLQLWRSHKVQVIEQQTIFLIRIKFLQDKIRLQGWDDNKYNMSLTQKTLHFAHSSNVNYVLSIISSNQIKQKIRREDLHAVQNSLPTHFVLSAKKKNKRLSQTVIWLFSQKLKLVYKQNHVRTKRTIKLLTRTN